jgi:hypothetical protein
MTKKFSPPAIQHLARSMQDTPEAVAKSLISAYLSHPPFSYRLMGELIRQAMRGGTFSKSQFDAAVIAHQKNEKYQKIFLELTPLIHAYFSKLTPKFILPVPSQKYRVNQLEIPFKPPFAFEADGQIVIPWFIFWKTNPLTGKQYSLLATLLSELLSQDPDYRDAKIIIYDFSAASDGEERTLKVIDTADIPKMSPRERDAALTIFLDGYELALAQIASMPKREETSSNKKSDGAQLQLLDLKKGT